jgi:hypothetical protein
MENHTELVGKEQLSEKVDKLTEENQQCCTRVLEALNFAQNTQNQVYTKSKGVENENA